MRNFIFILFILIHGISFASEGRKKVIITGASGELGGATARLMAEHYDLVLTGRNKEKLEKLQGELKGKYQGQYDTCFLDFTNEESITQFKEKLGSVDGLLLIYPRPPFYGKALIQEEKMWLDVFKTTFTGPMKVMHDVIPHLSSHGKIVVISGLTSAQYIPDCGPSCVIRRMWSTYCKALSHELGPKGIAINVLSPDVIMTNFHKDRIQKQSQKTGLSYEEQLGQEVAKIPLRRHGEPHEIAHTIQFLLSDESDFINGVNLILDGGASLSY